MMQKIAKSISLDKFPKSLLLIGTLEELVCDTPLEKEVDASALIENRSGKPLLVCSSADGRFVMIVSPDKVEMANTEIPQIALPLAARKNPSSCPPPPDLSKAISLHTDFHGVEPPEIKKVNVKEFDRVVFFGWLTHIVYDVPDYSERRGLPFIHEAGDKGKGIPKAKERPIVCVTPNRDMLVMLGDEMEFTDRGIIG